MAQRGLSKKHRDFVSEPIGDKHVTELAGVGAVIGRRMEKAGASMVLGHYLAEREDPHRFQQWMKENYHASSKQSEDCYNCLKDWTASHVK
ncbi:barrier-to-autointegration factor-like isoform X2 [Pararge aegeria]|uniref:barrier-to-autointegration factor-like isoform X2 n=1 Tax=Pararge aegeria TaxID=116150 RepID=UPI0019D2FB6C|nr:barrier-to-autointegration factor-like isoform X2 [Pararge aegeria]